MDKKTGWKIYDRGRVNGMLEADDDLTARIVTAVLLGETDRGTESDYRNINIRKGYWTWLDNTWYFVCRDE